MRFLYVGLPLGALCLLRAGHVPRAVAIGHPDAVGMRRLRRRLPRETLILGAPDLRAGEVQSALRSTGAEALLSWFWPKKIPVELIRSVPRGAFGVHPSLLPRLRGPDPYFHAIRNGDSESGVTLHRLEAEYDTGAIIDQRRIPITAIDTGWTLARKLDRPSLALLVSCADRLARGEALEGIPQDEARVSLAPRPTEEDLVLDFAARSASELARVVRAAAPEPGATAMLEEHLVTVRAARAVQAELPGAIVPGEAFLERERVLVRCREGVLELSEVRVEDEDRILSGGEIAVLLRQAEG